ncbi:MAG: hypothetical protein Ct9H300mP17_14210 [Candidatus Nitrosopelagicus sp.]|nr:MAG: hypothetical protein Ct9H300mP17_14210 [Candidatus Nitrosopelagicus sp.]
MPKTNVHAKKKKSLEENLQECINEVVWAEKKEDTIYWLGRIHAFMKKADEQIMNYLFQ